ncbi:DUF308 domain-containing protein [Myxococcota bacterium]|nr:DUF308 domain-containing protein [Myxococcota bacterium]
MSEVRLPTPEEMSDALRRSWGLLLIVGALQIAVGFAAMLAPQVATVVGVEFLAVLLWISGVAQGLMVFRVKGWSGSAWLLLGAFVAVAAGTAILMNPRGGAVAITLLFAVVCIADGVSRLFLGLGAGAQGRRGWIVVSGLASLAVGGLLAVEWPGDSVWAIGLLMGVNLFMGGMSLSAIALAARGSGEPTSD